jgi:hypothetical protein
MHTTAAVKAKPVEVHTAPVVGAKPMMAVHMAPVVKAKPIEVHVEPKPLLVHSAAPKVNKTTVEVHLAPAVSPRDIAVHTGTSGSLMRAKGQMKVLYNHTTLRLDRPITPRAGVMFSPLRQIFEYQGGALTWQRSTGEVHATSESKDILLTIGRRKAVVNNQQTLLELAPYLDGGRTMVPLSFLPLALDVNVQFDAASGHLLITSKE